MTKKNKEKIIKYLLAKPRTQDNRVDFVPKNYSEFPEIDNSEIKAYFGELDSMGHIVCNFLTHKDDAWCNIKLNAAILSYFDNKKQNRRERFKDNFRYTLSLIISLISLLVSVISVVISISNNK